MLDSVEKVYMVGEVTVLSLYNMYCEVVVS